MFEVRSASPFDDDWEERDAAIMESVSGMGESHFSGTNFCVRDHGWMVKTIEEAIELKRRLETVPLVTATFREY